MSVPTNGEDLTVLGALPISIHRPIVQCVPSVTLTILSAIVARTRSTAAVMQFPSRRTTLGGTVSVHAATTGQVSIVRPVRGALPRTGTAIRAQTVSWGTPLTKMPADLAQRNLTVLEMPTQYHRVSHTRPAIVHAPISGQVTAATYAPPTSPVLCATVALRATLLTPSVDSVTWTLTATVGQSPCHRMAHTQFVFATANTSGQGHPVGHAPPVTEAPTVINATSAALIIRTAAFVMSISTARRTLTL